MDAAEYSSKPQKLPEQPEQTKPPKKKKRDLALWVGGAFILVGLICSITILAMWDEPHFNGVRYGTHLPQLEGMEEVVYDSDWLEEEAQEESDSTEESTKYYRRSGDRKIFWGVPVAHIEYGFEYDIFSEGVVCANSSLSREWLYEALCKRCFRLVRLGDGETDRSGIWVRLPNLYLYRERPELSSRWAEMTIVNIPTKGKIERIQEQLGGL